MLGMYACIVYKLEWFPSGQNVSKCFLHAAVSISGCPVEMKIHLRNFIITIFFQGNLIC